VPLVLLLERLPTPSVVYGECASSPRCHFPWAPALLPSCTSAHPPPADHQNPSVCDDRRATLQRNGSQRFPQAWRGARAWPRKGAQTVFGSPAVQALSGTAVTTRWW